MEVEEEADWDERGSFGLVGTRTVFKMRTEKEARSCAGENISDQTDPEDGERHCTSPAGQMGGRGAARRRGERGHMVAVPGVTDCWASSSCCVQAAVPAGRTPH